MHPAAIIRRNGHMEEEGKIPEILLDEENEL